MEALTDLHTCPKCGEDKWPEEFAERKPGQGWVDDRPHLPITNRCPYCRKCEVERISAWKARNGDKQKAYQRAYRERNVDKIRAYNNSPEGRAKRAIREARRQRKIHRNKAALQQHREKARLLAWEARRRRGAVETPKAGPKAPDTEKDLRLDSAVFAQWLKAKQREYGGPEQLALVIGMSPRNVRHYLVREYPRVSIDTVDRALIREGTTFLWQLYPELYPGLDVPSLTEILADVVGPPTNHDAACLKPREQVVA